MFLKSQKFFFNIIINQLNTSKYLVLKKNIFDFNNLKANI